MRYLTTTAGVVLVTLWLFAAPVLSEKGQAGPQLRKEPITEENHAIKVRVNEVIVPVTILDSKGEMISDLTKDKFHIFDNRVEQTIEQFDLGGDALAVALVIETSSHIQMMAPAIHRIGSVFTETVMAIEGTAAVITYDNTVEVQQPFTKDHDAIERAIGKVNFKAPEMRLYDAMSTAVGLLKMQPSKFRRVMLIIGESQDRSSEAKFGLVLRDVLLANISIYAVGPSSTSADLRYGTNGSSAVPLPGSLPPASTQAPPRDPMGRPYFDVLSPAIWLLTRGTNEIKNHQLEIAAASTGGVHYRALNDRTIESAIDKIGGEIHAQYIMSYSPTTESSSGFHKIDVTVVRPGAAVRARSGYFTDTVPDLSPTQRADP
ncbi:MAG: VWA domain-containing protein [Candidatus Acidiferrales bacterium]|jgi:VWFA-related protein